MVLNEKSKNLNKKYNCPICGSTNIKNWLICDDGQVLDCCKDCGTGYLTPYPTKISNLYQDYGEHITNLPDSYFNKRLKIGFKKYFAFFLIKRISGENIKLLDYGGGAGFFINSSQKLGIKNSYLFEPSENLRRTAIEKVGIKKNYVTDNLSKFKLKFNFVSMFDVIEHLPQERVHPLVQELKKHMEPGSYLFGQTPNRLSLNLKISRSKDPVISPPSHLIYFTKKSLDKLLRENGFEKKFLLTYGLSTNGFFRRNKFEPSFIEQPKSMFQKLISFFIKTFFKLLGIIMVFSGTGYQIVFLYKLGDKK